MIYKTDHWKVCSTDKEDIKKQGLMEVVRQRMCSNIRVEEDLCIF